MMGQAYSSFESVLVSALRLVPGYLIKAAADAKLPHQSDMAYSSLASALAERIEGNGWTTSRAGACVDSDAHFVPLEPLAEAA